MQTKKWKRRLDKCKEEVWSAKKGISVKLTLYSVKYCFGWYFEMKMYILMALQEKGKYL